MIIFWWTEDDNKIHYRCRGTGAVYRSFYEWLKTTSYRCTHDDWPWDYFVFDNEKDSMRLMTAFGEYVKEDTQ